MPIITLTSDYGYTDYRLAAIKGSILSRNPDAKIVDITHNIQAYDLQQTAYIVGNAYRHFPPGSIHIISVDSSYHKERKYIIYKADGHYFLAADNGVLSLIFYDIKPEKIYEITINTRFDDVVNFATTDILVPAALHLQNGGLPEVIGRKYKTPRELSFPNAGSKDDFIFGEVLYIDNYGNIISNITKKLFDEMMSLHTSFSIRFRTLALSKIYRTHTGVVTDWETEHEQHGKPAAIFNDSGLLELTIYKGTAENGARTLFGLKVGEPIYIEFKKN
ncbi:S-adenosyl-l-methionine hydroxide adenosyltransferase family protein [Chryseobacterium sp. MFBS3-17]|uniref:SAM hydrolase/SAM-dependent halogenase family protein n=1 Tax=Chryseobacterium sp. MFBS3-17 TaxID=2886689 RepID=UPI001D0DF3D7|nr:SAM-dependent chlorinase/fluorinase [Chryseobacterium sp. MFBS3-17]MCC2591720.1 SAM-dependent chlorinase/fluorinase [Chryseobacterium sp. MFBS3-17]